MFDYTLNMKPQDPKAQAFAGADVKEPLESVMGLGFRV